MLIVVQKIGSVLNKTQQRAAIAKCSIVTVFAWHYIFCCVLRVVQNQHWRPKRQRWVEAFSIIVWHWHLKSIIFSVHFRYSAQLLCTYSIQFFNFQFNSQRSANTRCLSVFPPNHRAPSASIRPTSRRLTNPCAQPNHQGCMGQNRVVAKSVARLH